MSESLLSNQTIVFYFYMNIRIQMELDTRKNESKAQLKQQTIAIEVRMILISVVQFGNFAIGSPE
jgi:hypothetical protein